MKRVLLDIQEEDLTQLERLADDDGVSRASILRDAVAEYLVRRDRPTLVKRKPLKGFGMLQGSLPDGIEYQERMRSEWR